MRKYWSNKIATVVLIVMLGLAVMPVTPAYAAGTITSTASGGAWNVGGTWIGGVVPGAGDSVVIETGATVTLSSATTVDGSLTIQSGATLITSNFALTLAGDFSNSGSFTAGSSNINLSGSTAQSIAGFTTGGAVSMLKTGGTATFAGNVSAGGLTINGSGGTLDLGVGLTHIFTGVWTRTAGTLNGGSSTLNLIGGLSGAGGTFTAGTGTVNYNGAAQTVAGVTYNNLTAGGSGIKTINGDVTVNGNLTVNSGTTFTVVGFNMTVNGTTLVTGTLTHATSASGSKTYKGLVTVNGTWTNSINAAINFQGGLTNNGTFTAGTGIYTFDTNDQNIDGSQSISISNVTVAAGVTLTNTNNGTFTVGTALSGISGGLTQDVNSILNIGGTSNIGTLTASASGNTVNYNGAAQTVKAATYHHLTLSGTGAKDLTGLSTVNGNLTFSGTTASATISSPLHVFGNLTFQGTQASSFTANGNLTVDGDLVVGLTSGASGSTTLTVGAVNITVMGTTTINGTNTNVNGVLTHSSSTGTKIYTGLVTIAANGIWNNSGNANVTLRGGLRNNSAETFVAGSGVYTFDTNDQTIDGSQSVSIPKVTVTVVKLTNSNTGTSGLTVDTALSGTGELIQGTIASPGPTLNIGVTPTISILTATANPNTVNYNGAAQSVKATVYHHLTLSGSGVKTLPSGLTTVNGNLTLSGTASATTADALTIGGNLAIGTGTAFTVGAFNITVTGTTTLSGTATLTHSSATGTKTYTGDVTIGAGSTWYDNATTDGNIAITFGGSLQNNGTINAGTGVHTFTGTGETFSGTGGISIPNVTITGSYTNNCTTNNKPLEVGTALSGSGSLTQGTSATLKIGGTSGITTLTASASLNTVNYSMLGAQTIRAITYHHLSTSGTSTKTLAGATTLNGNLTIGSGTTLDVGSNYGLTVKGTWTNGGTFTPQLGTVTLNGSTAQTMSGVSSFNNLTINNTSTGVTISNNMTVNATLTLTSGKITTGGSSLIIGTAGSIANASAARYVFGNLRKDFPAGAPSFTFPIGDATNYTPVVLAFASVTTPGTVTAKSTAGEDPHIDTSGLNASKDVNRYWTLTPAGGLIFTTYDVTFNFIGGTPVDLDSGAATGSFVVKRKSNATTWSSTTTGTRTATSTQATGVNSMSGTNNFAIGEPDATAPTVPTSPGVSSTEVSGSYKAGVTIHITITFSEKIVVTGTPTLTLNTTPTNRVVNCPAVSNTVTLTCNYTIQAGDTSSDLDYLTASSLTLGGGVTIKDYAGNNAVLTLPSPGATGSLGANRNIVIDTTAPTVLSFVRQTPSGSSTNADTLIFRATFSEAVNGVNTADFAVSGTTATVASISPVSTSVYDLTVSGGDLAGLDGVVGLNFNAPSITDLAGNAFVNAEPATDETYTVDNTAPSVTSFTRKTPPGSPTNADTLVFLATFSEAVTNVDTADFVKNTSSTASISSVTQVTTSTYDVTISGGNLNVFNGTVNLNLSATPTINDLAGNALPAGEPATDQTYTVDNTGPTVTSFTLKTPASSPTNADTLVFLVTFSEAVTNVDTADFVKNTSSTASISSVTQVTTSTYDVTISGGNLNVFNGTVNLDLSATPTIDDLDTNPLLPGQPSIDQTYTVDNIAPSVTSFTLKTPASSPTNADTLVFLVTFSEAVTNVDTADFVKNTSSTASISSVTQVTTSTYDVTISGGNLNVFNGTVNLNLSATPTINDLAGNALPAGEPATDQTYTVDNTGPVVSSIVRADPDPTNSATVNFTVTFSEATLTVDTADFTLTTTGSVSSATVTGISGSGSTRTVTVNTGSGNGTIRLDVPVTATITDSVGNSLGSLPYTSGEIYTVNKTFYIFLPLVIR